MEVFKYIGLEYYIVCRVTIHLNPTELSNVKYESKMICGSSRYL